MSTESAVSSVVISRTPAIANKPKPFKGERDALIVSNFLTRMKTHMYRFDFKGELDQITYFGDFLEAEAAQWYGSFSIDFLQTCTFDEFLLGFERKYYNANRLETLLRRIKNASQQTTVEAYNVDFAELAAAIPSTALTDHTKRTFYIEGLKPPLQHTVRNYNPQTLEDAMIIASNASEGEPAGHLQAKSLFEHPADEEDILMDVNAIHVNPSTVRRSRLTPQERMLLKKLGICFRCRAGRHMAKDCPQASSP